MHNSISRNYIIKHSFRVLLISSLTFPNFSLKNKSPTKSPKPMIQSQMMINLVKQLKKLIFNYN